MGKAIEAINGFVGEERLLLKENVGQGAKALYANLDQGIVTYSVYATDRNGADVLMGKIAETPHRDMAAHLYESFDGHVRPWNSAYQPRGYNGADRKGEKTHVVFAVGPDVGACLNAFADSLGHGGADGREVTSTGDGGWSARFTIDGQSMKAAGVYVPGGCIMTSWQ